MSKLALALAVSLVFGCAANGTESPIASSDTGTQDDGAIHDDGAPSTDVALAGYSTRSGQRLAGGCVVATAMETTPGSADVRVQFGQAAARAEDGAAEYATWTNAIARGGTPLSQSWLLTATTDDGVRTAKGPFRPNASTSDVPAFVAKCGDRYVSVEHLGARVDVRFFVDFDAPATKLDFDRRYTFSPTWEMLRFTLQDARTTYRDRIAIRAVASDSSLDVSKCRIDDLRACDDLYARAIAVATARRGANQILRMETEAYAAPAIPKVPAAALELATSFRERLALRAELESTFGASDAAKRAAVASLLDADVTAMQQAIVACHAFPAPDCASLVSSMKLHALSDLRTALDAARVRGFENKGLQRVGSYAKVCIAIDGDGTIAGLACNDRPEQQWSLANDGRLHSTASPDQCLSAAAAEPGYMIGLAACASAIGGFKLEDSGLLRSGDACVDLDRRASFTSCGGYSVSKFVLR